LGGLGDKSRSTALEMALEGASRSSRNAQLLDLLAATPQKSASKFGLLLRANVNHHGDSKPLRTNKISRSSP
jgi:hypothetical protein